MQTYDYQPPRIGKMAPGTKEPDRDQRGGPSDKDADNRRMGIVKRAQHKKACKK